MPFEIKESQWAVRDCPFTPHGRAHTNPYTFDGSDRNTLGYLTCLAPPPPGRSAKNSSDFLLSQKASLSLFIIFKPAQLYQLINCIINSCIRHQFLDCTDFFVVLVPKDCLHGLECLREFQNTAFIPARRHVGKTEAQSCIISSASPALCEESQGSEAHC